MVQKGKQMILKILQFFLLGLIATISVMLLKHQYIIHYPVGSIGKCIVFYSKVSEERLIKGVIEEYSIPKGNAKILISEPQILSDDIGMIFQNEEIRNKGYILLECEDE